MADKVVCETPFVSLIERDGYVFSHENRCDGQIVAILPFKGKGKRRQYLARLEVCPAHSPHIEPCSITGGVNPGEGVRETALHELLEEAGYTVQDADLIALGTVRPSKSADTTVHLFAVNIKGMQAGIATGDGTKFEEGAGTAWVDYAQAMDNKDPLFITAIARLNAQER
ncbi:MAG: NUDIX domain-containing protein [bacterium]|nr:NUDIX domain-containing protein [bacterium]